MTELFRSGLGRERNLKMTIKSPDGREVDFVKSPLVGHQASTSYPPRLGEHSGEILRDILGFREDEIETLQNQGVVSKNRA
jgi:formyl-CoA transferase